MPLMIDVGGCVAGAHSVIETNRIWQCSGRYE
jgi:hypothetical protein